MNCSELLGPNCPDHSSDICENPQASFLSTLIPLVLVHLILLLKRLSEGFIIVCEDVPVRNLQSGDKGMDNSP